MKIQAGWVGLQPHRAPGKQLGVHAVGFLAAQSASMVSVVVAAAAVVVAAVAAAAVAAAAAAVAAEVETIYYFLAESLHILDSAELQLHSEQFEPGDY